MYEQQRTTLYHNAELLDVVRQRTFRGWFTVRQGRFWLVEEAGSPAPPCDESVDLAGRTVMPGLVDIHTHIESSFVTPRRYAEAVLPQGTTTVLTDPHEIANVLGGQGIQFMLDSSEHIPLDVYLSLPSCVPATSLDLETSAEILTAGDLEPFVGHPRVIALGEVMNYRGVLQGDARLVDIVAMARRRGLLIEGHVPTLSGQDLSRYLSHGVRTDHTLAYPEKILEQLSKGVCVEIQEKSITRQNIDVLRSVPDLSRVVFVTDDVVASRILRGHLLHNVKKAIEMGMDTYEALSCATCRPAAVLGLCDVGIIAPGFIADFLVLDNLADLNVNSVYKAGRLVARDGVCVCNECGSGGDQDLPGWVLETVKLPLLSRDDFRVPLPDGVHRVHVIEANSVNTVTSLGTGTVTVRDGFAELPGDADVVLAEVLERHGRRRGQEGKGLAFVRGYGLRSGACATTVAHDAHNLLVLGRDADAMATAANAVIESGGGIAVGEGTRVLRHVPLPVAGLMSDRPVKEVAREFESLEADLVRLGVSHRQPLLFLVMLTLATSPGFKVTDRGLVDVERQALLLLLAG